MKLKRDANGNVVVVNDMPVYVHDDGTEAPFDAAGTVAAIKARNGEAKTNRERAEAAEAKLKLFEGIEDPAAALKALATIKNLDDKKLVDAGQVEQVKAEINKAWETKLGDATKRTAELEQQLHSAVVGGAFARSKFLSEKTTLPTDIAEAYFGRHVKLEKGQIRITGADGNPIYSKTKPGEPAEFDEAIEILVSSHPQRDNFLRGTNGSGSGAPPGGGSGGAGKTMSRAQFSQLSPAEQMKTVQGGAQITD